MIEGGCDVVHRDTTASACLFNLNSEPDWAALFGTLEALSLWTLPDESVLPKCVPGEYRVIDTGGIPLLYEIFDGTSYRAYHYSDLFSDSPWPEEREATRLGGAVLDILYHVPPKED
ncbi:MAG: hypothetical protein AAGI91_15195 [Bacteroidota bacterium]